MPCISEIIDAIGRAAPLSAQEEWDNSGLIVDYPQSGDCTGVMLCLDVTPEVIGQALEAGCNLIVSHHPLIFKGIKKLNGNSVQGEALIAAVRHGISVYSAHTSLDNAPEQWNVSGEMARMLGLNIIGPLATSGTGVIAMTDSAVSGTELARQCRKAFSADGVRHSSIDMPVRKIALGSGSCGFLIPEAIAAGADAIITSDVRYHDFLDYQHSLFIVDLTHFDTEKCTKGIFKRIISQKIPNFARVYCASETNPIAFLQVTP